MNPVITAIIAAINSNIVTNGEQNITAVILNPILDGIVDTLYGIAGNNQDLQTAAKNNLVAAINELKNQLDLINPIEHYNGGADPNVEPPNGGDFNVLDFYTQTGVGGAEALWIYTGVPSIGWLNLTGNLNSVLYTAQNLTIPQKKQALLNLGYIEINENIFEYRRNPANATVGIIPGEIALNGWVTPTQFGKLLIYVGGTVTNSSSWNIVDSIDF